MKNHMNENIYHQKESKKMIASVIVGILLGGATIGFAANNYVQALLNQEIKVSLNGVVQTFKDETTGEVQYPLTYRNRTYLPLRNVAQLSGVEVDYDSENNTVKLNNKNNTNNSYKDYPDGPFINKNPEPGTDFTTGDYLFVSKDEFNIKKNYFGNEISADVSPIGDYAVIYPEGYYYGNYYKYEWKAEDENIIKIIKDRKYEPTVEFDAKNVGTTNIVLTVTTADDKETVTKNIVVNVTE